MSEIALREMQQIEMELLLELDRVCRENKLRFYLDGGTLLGAVCYDGFIPWDDDIDIKMPRPDYERLLTLQQAFPAHILLDAPRPGHCEYTFLKLVDNRTVLEEDTGIQKKVSGVYIDVLPMDGHPEDAETCRKHISAMNRYSNLFHESQTQFRQMKRSKNLITKAKGHLYGLIYTPWILSRKMTKLGKKYSYDSASRVGLLIDGDPARERFEKTWLEPPAIMEFEGHQFPAPNAAEEHLSIFYRKPISRALYYHNLPRIPSTHKHRVYWKDQPACGDRPYNEANGAEHHDERE